MLLNYGKDQPAVLINTSTKSPKHFHLESLENFYRIFSENKG